MRIVADENILFAREAFEQFGDLRLLPGRGIDRAALAEADALVVRSITRVDSALLEGTPVRFVGTATIGTDHIDLDYLRSRGIDFADAAGSNARSVAEYVVAALLRIREIRRDYWEDGGAVGVVGVGHVGSLVVEMVRALGMRPIPYDPPRAAREPGFPSATLDEVLAAPFITLHLPLVREGAYPTHHLVDARFLDRMDRSAWLLNTSRGAVVDSAALMNALDAGALAGAVLDVWEGEPAMPVDLLDRALLATPHIAGYSFDGKLRGTTMMADALARHAGTASEWEVPMLRVPIAGMARPRTDIPVQDAVADMVRGVYDITADDRRLRNALSLDEAGRRGAFDRLRREYPDRREFRAVMVLTDDDELRLRLGSLGFTLPPRS